MLPSPWTTLKELGRAEQVAVDLRSGGGVSSGGIGPSRVQREGHRAPSSGAGTGHGLPYSAATVPRDLPPQRSAPQATQDRPPLAPVDRANMAGQVSTQDAASPTPHSGTAYTPRKRIAGRAHVCVRCLAAPASPTEPRTASAATAAETAEVRDATMVSRSLLSQVQPLSGRE